MSVADARSALELAEREAAEAQKRALAAEESHREQQTLASAKAQREARELAADHQSVVEVKRAALTAALQVEAEQGRAEAARELANVDAVIQDDRRRLGKFSQELAGNYGQLIKLVSEISDLIETDSRYVRKANDLAKAAGTRYTEAALDLDVVRVALGIKLAECFGPSETSTQTFPPGGKLARALAKLQGVQSYAAASAGLESAIAELSFEEGSTFIDWLRPTPRRPEAGTTFAELQQQALALLGRYVGEVPDPDFHQELADLRALLREPRDTP